MTVQLGFKAKEIIAEGRVTSDDIKQISIWISEQINLPVISDEEIVNFLLSNDNDQEKTKNTINAFFHIRNAAPEIFSNRLVSKENSGANQLVSYFAMAPKRTNDNCAVIFARLHDTKFRNFNLSLFIKFIFMTLDAAVYSSSPNGLIIVLDMDGYGIMHLTRLGIGNLKTFFRYLQEALPVKLKNIHILNTVYFIDKLLGIIKPLMSEHVKEVMIFHKRECNMDEFFEKYVTKELMPEDFGGELPCMKDLAQQLMENFQDMESYFTAEENRRSVLQS